MKKGKVMKNETRIIGKNVIVRATIAGVHAGEVISFNPAAQTVELKNAYRLWRFYTREKSGSISDVAANGLKPNGGHSIGACLKSVTIVNQAGLEIAEMSDDAYDSIKAWKN
jgi:hypothetical protein